MSNLVKRNGQHSIQEIKRQYATLANTLAKIVTAIEDGKERRKQLDEQIKRRCERELAEKREINERLRIQQEQLSETVGGLKLALALLKKAGIEAPAGKLDDLAERHEDIKQLVNSN